MRIWRKRRSEWRSILERIEETIIDLRACQLRGVPRAELSLNICLDNWTRAHDRLVLQAYEQEVMNLQSPDYHG